MAAQASVAIVGGVGCRGVRSWASLLAAARTARQLAELLDEVADRRQHVTVTRRGRPAAALVPADEYEALEEIAAIRRGVDDLTAGNVAPLDQVRVEHTARNRSWCPGSPSPARPVKHWPPWTPCAPTRYSTHSASSRHAFGAAWSSLWPGLTDRRDEGIAAWTPMRACCAVAAVRSRSGAPVPGTGSRPTASAGPSHV